MTWQKKFNRKVQANNRLKQKIIVQEVQACDSLALELHPPNAWQLVWKRAQTGRGLFVAILCQALILLLFQQILSLSHPYYIRNTQ